MSDFWKQLAARNEQVAPQPEPDTPDEDGEEEVPEEVKRQRELYAEAKLVAAADFYGKYGFVHECSCMEDYAVGNVDIVPICFLEMVNEAMKLISVYNEFANKLADSHPELSGELQESLEEATRRAKSLMEDDDESEEDDDAV